jgi:hypothetical protein
VFKGFTENLPNSCKLETGLEPSIHYVFFLGLNRLMQKRENAEESQEMFRFRLCTTV